MVEFKCPACDLAFGDVEACFRHIRIHPQRTIQCPECRVDFRSLEAFKKHFRQRHLAKSAGPVFKCSVDGCEFFENNINKVYKHASWHVAKGQPVFCPFGCKTSKPLPTSNALRIHQMYFHRNRSAKATSVETECHPEPDQIQQDEPMELDTAGTGEMWIRPVATDLHRVEMVFGGLFLKLLSKNHVPDSAIQEIVVALGEAETAQTELLRSALRQAAITVEMNESSRTNLENLLGTTNVMGRCFGQAGLFRTAHMRKKYFRGNFRFVEPVNISLQRNDEHNQCNYYYVPILETLKSMLEDEKLFKVLFRERNTNPGFMTDYTDGQKFQNSTFFSNNTLNIFIYQDAAEVVVNAIGNATGRHKLLCVYMVLGNLPPHLRCLTENVQLVLLCKNKDFAYFGPNKIFRRLIEDMKVLEQEGIEINRGSENIRIFGSIFTTMNDNLGAHQISGLTENFSRSPYFCRTCYIVHDQFSSDCLYQARPRTPVTHAEDLRVLSENPTVPYRGVKSTTIFNELAYFNMFDYGAAPCVAHDLFEGWANFDIFLILRRLVQERLVTKSYLQIRANFILKKLKIKTQIALDFTRRTKTIKAKACDVWHLIQIMPLLLLKCNIDDSNPMLSMLLLMKNICDIVTSPVISNDQIYLLAALITDYMEKRATEFDVPLRPKHHFTAHYPKMILWLGPLMQYCTMYCERKHCFFKRALRSTLNFKNVLKFCSEHHQYYQGVLNVQNRRFEDKITIEKFVEKYQDLPDSTQDQLNTFSLLEPNMIYIETGCYQGHTYSKNDYLYLQHDEYSNSIVFLKLKLVIFDSALNRIHVLGEKWTVVDIHERGILEVDRTGGEIDCKLIEDFVDKTPITSYFENKKEYLFIKHAIPLQ